MPRPTPQRVGSPFPRPHKPTEAPHRAVACRRSSNGKEAACDTPCVAGAVSTIARTPRDSVCASSNNGRRTRSSANDCGARARTRPTRSKTRIFAPNSSLLTATASWRPAAREAANLDGEGTGPRHRCMGQNLLDTRASLATAGGCDPPVPLAGTAIKRSRARRLGGATMRFAPLSSTRRGHAQAHMLAGSVHLRAAQGSSGKQPACNTPLAACALSAAVRKHRPPQSAGPNHGRRARPCCRSWGACALACARVCIHLAQRLAPLLHTLLCRQPRPAAAQPRTKLQTWAEKTLGTGTGECATTASTNGPATGGRNKQTQTREAARPGLRPGWPCLHG